jgi:hypothetical protein
VLQLLLPYYSIAVAGKGDGGQVLLLLQLAACYFNIVTRALLQLHV